MIILGSEAITYDDLILIPKYSDINSRSVVDISSELINSLSPFKIPIISANMDTITEFDMCFAMDMAGGLGIIHRNMTIENMILQIKKLDKLTNSYLHKANYGISVGVKGEELERAAQAIELGCKIICVDVAHAHTKMVETFLKLLLKYTEANKVEVIVGNISTNDAAHFLFDQGIKCVKVGQGSGSVCTTRLVTGHGVPQVTALLEVCRARTCVDQKVIADGGIKTSGDIVKALALGADAVMVGSLFAGSYETPGVNNNGKKEYRGMASAEAGLTKSVPEGISHMVKSGQSASNIIRNLAAGIRSGFSYSGASNLKELRNKAVFQKISKASYAESHPHILDRK